MGYTTLASQRNSLDEIGLQQLGIATHLDATAGLLTGANQPLEGDNEIGVLGGIGSYTLGVTGRYNLAEGFSLLGGASIVNFGMPGASASGLLAAGALRFVQPGASEFKYFGEAGNPTGIAGFRVFRVITTTARPRTTRRALRAMACLAASMLGAERCGRLTRTTTSCSRRR